MTKTITIVRNIKMNYYSPEMDQKSRDWYDDLYDELTSSGRYNVVFLNNTEALGRYMESEEIGKNHVFVFSEEWEEEHLEPIKKMLIFEGVSEGKIRNISFLKKGEGSIEERIENWLSEVGLEVGVQKERE